MGTIVEMKVVASGEAVAAAALDAAFAELDRVERLATPHEAASALSRANARADSTFRVGPELDAMLALSLRVAASTGGAFDPTIAPLVEAWGFPDAPRHPDSATVATARAAVDWTGLRPDASGAGWVLADPAARLDLGGVAKGWAVDRAAEILALRAGPCLVNAGGDLRALGAKPGGKPWVVGIQHPRDPSALACRIRVPEGAAVATSGDYERFFEEDGVRYHHLLDPKTGFPARGPVSATVVAPTCAEADAWATAAFVLGVDEGLRRLEAEPDLEGLLIALDPAGGLVLRETSGFTALRLP